VRTPGVGSVSSPTGATLACGPLTWRFRGDPALLAVVEDRYRDFLGGVGTLEHEVRLELGAELDGQHPTRYRVVWTEDAVAIESGIVRGRLDPIARECVLRVVPPGRPGLAPVLPGQAIENFLRIATALLAPIHDILLVHGAGVMRTGGGSAVVFHGPSGAGKSTVARLSAAHSLAHVVLGDDLVLVTCTPAGDAAVAATPFWGDDRPAPRPLAPVPLAGRYELQQADRDQVQRLELAEGMGSLVAAIPFQGFMRHADLAALCALAERVLARVPGFTLRFRPTALLWQAVEASLP
jgi:hypothetical protein